jgi:energy-converting hydrogenase Eha subunit E
MLFWALSSNVSARLVVPWGFRTTARTGASVIVIGFLGLVACARFDAEVAWISVACGIIGCGLGFVALTQVLAIQHSTAESIRGVATSLVPFFRAIGGALGVGALGALLSFGLVARLGVAATETAGGLLTGGHGPGLRTQGADEAQLRQALESSLLPVFGVLLGLAVLNLLVTGLFPARADDREQSAPPATPQP